MSRQSHNRDKHLLTLESLQAQNNVQSTPDCQLILNRVPVEFPMGTDSLALPITRGLIHGALNNLGIDLRNGALIGATPLGQWTRNMTRMPIILSFDSPETRKEVLKAANKKNQKGPGAFPIWGVEKLYFTEVQKPHPKTNLFKNGGTSKHERCRNRRNARKSSEEPRPKQKGKPS